MMNVFCTVISSVFYLAKKNSTINIRIYVNVDLSSLTCEMRTNEDTIKRRGYIIRHAIFAENKFSKTAPTFQLGWLKYFFYSQ